MIQRVILGLSRISSSRIHPSVLKCSLFSSSYTVLKCQSVRTLTLRRKNEVKKFPDISRNPKGKSPNGIIDCLMDALPCERAIAQKMSEEMVNLKGVDLANIRSVVRILLAKNISVSAIAENALILAIPTGSFGIKLILNLAPILTYNISIHCRTFKKEAGTSVGYEFTRHK